MTNLGSCGQCTEYTPPQDEADSPVIGLIHENRRIGPALEVIATSHLGRYGVEIKIVSLHVMDPNLVF